MAQEPTSDIQNIIKSRWKKFWKFEMQNNGLDPWKSDIVQSFASPTYFWSFNVKKLQCVLEAHLFPCIAQKC